MDASEDEGMSEAERLRLVGLATAGKLFDDDGKKITIFHPSLRKPAKEVIPPPPKSDVAQALELVAKAMEDAQKISTTASLTQTTVLVEALSQNQEVLTRVMTREAPEKVMELWDVVFKRSEKGIVGATMKQIK